MKSISRISALIMVCTLLFITGCEKTEPDVPTADRDKFIGTWHGTSTGSVSGSRTFNMKIRASASAPDQVIMEEFDGLASGTFLSAVVSGSSLSIISTSVSGETYDGTGSLSGTRITFTFTVDDGQTVENRTATADKI